MVIECKKPKLQNECIFYFISWNIYCIVNNF